MRRDWFRIELSTLAVSVLGGLLPVAVISIVSFLSLSTLSEPLRDIVLHHHQSLLRNQATRVDAEIATRLRAIGDHLAERLYRARALASSMEDAGIPRSAPPGDWDLIQDVLWHPAESPLASPPVAGARQDSAESILVALQTEPDSARKREQLAALSALSPLVQDPVGFSYATEASLYLGLQNEAFQRQLLVHGARLDRATLEAAVANLGGALHLEELPFAITLRLDQPAVHPGESRLRAEQPRILLLGEEAPAGGVLVLEIDGGTLLSRAFEAVAGNEPGSAGAALSLRAVGSGASEPQDASLPEALFHPLSPPFAGVSEIVLQPSAEESAFPLGLLARMRGVHYLWWVMAVLLSGIVGSILLGVVASRRVQSSQKKDDFLRLVSHQLRTPIASLKVLAETLSLGRVRGEIERHELTTQLQRETDRLAELVERVLEYGRSEGGRANAREVVSDPGDLVEEAVRTFVERNPNSGEIIMRTAQEFHPVVLDRSAVIQVVLNLLSNARKFSGPEPPIEVTVGEESRNLFVEVKDQGPGIRKRDQRKVFRAFYRADPSSGPPGFGLGLAYCKKVAEAHRGKMRVASTPGRGAAFTLEIPLVYPVDYPGVYPGVSPGDSPADSPEEKGA